MTAATSTGTEALVHELVGQAALADETRADGGSLRRQRRSDVGRCSGVGTRRSTWACAPTARVPCHEDERAEQEGENTPEYIYNIDILLIT